MRVADPGTQLHACVTPGPVEVLKEPCLGQGGEACGTGEGVVGGGNRSASVIYMSSSAGTSDGGGSTAMLLRTRAVAKKADPELRRRAGQLK